MTSDLMFTAKLHATIFLFWPHLELSEKIKKESIGLYYSCRLRRRQKRKKVLLELWRSLLKIYPSVLSLSLSESKVKG